jgi:hypothetical protein
MRTVSTAELKADVEAFEKKYRMSSDEFMRKFESGEMGDSADAVEWSALLEWIRREEASDS